MSAGWKAQLRDDATDWLLDPQTPVVRAAALQVLSGLPSDDPQVAQARAEAMATDPIRSILTAQDGQGWWQKPGPGYAPKYTGTVWQLMFLDQLGADPTDDRVRRACEYVLAHSVAVSGGVGASGEATERPPAPSRVIHCLNGNVVRALIGFGYLDDPRVQTAIDWAATRITGEGVDRWYASGTSGRLFACVANEGQPCAWGAVKELRALARIPRPRRRPVVRRAIDAGVEFLLSRDPAVADYPFPSYDTKPSRAWFSLGFPSAYVTDVLQNLETLVELGRASDPRLSNAVAWLVSAQDAHGRWVNRHAYNGKTTVDIEQQGVPSKWVTLRAYAVLKAVG